MFMNSKDIKKFNKMMEKEAERLEKPKKRKEKKK